MPMLARIQHGRSGNTFPDFSQWKDHDFYQQALSKLMQDWQAPPQAPAHQQRLRQLLGISETESAG
jgi:hypothetical protein